jgi:hypothetical protein
MIDIEKEDKETAELLLDYFDIPETKADFYIINTKKLHEEEGKKLLVSEDTLFCKVALFLCAEAQVKYSRSHFGFYSTETYSSEKELQQVKKHLEDCFGV